MRVRDVQGNLLKHITRLGSLSEAHIVQNVMQPLLQALQHLHAQVCPYATYALAHLCLAQHAECCEANCGTGLPSAPHAYNL